MADSLPSSIVVLQAIDLYVQQAYTAEPPAAVRARIEALRNLPAETIYNCPAWERDADKPGRCSIRLGNRFYPHMKLAVERSADGASVFFKADTHDRHCCPGPSSPEYKMFLSLMESNESIARQIETAWAEAGILTFKEYLRQDLQRRIAAAQGTE